MATRGGQGEEELASWQSLSRDLAIAAAVTTRLVGVHGKEAPLSKFWPCLAIGDVCHVKTRFIISCAHVQNLFEMLDFNLLVLFSCSGNPQILNVCGSYPCSDVLHFKESTDHNFN